MPVLLQLRTESNIPIFEQIVRGIEAWIMTGALREGDFLPSVRECAVKNSINPNTVAKAYQALQAKGWVESVRGTGLRVKRISASGLSERRDDLLDEQITSLIRVAASMDIKIPEVIERIKIYASKTTKGVS